MRDMLHQMWLGLKNFWGLRWLIKGPILAVLALFLVAIVAGVAGGGEKKEEKEAGAVVGNTTPVDRTTALVPATEALPTPEETAIPAPSATPEPMWATGPVNEQTVSAALNDIEEKMIRSDIKGNVKYVRIMDITGLNDAESPRLVIGFKPGTVLSETDFLTVAGASSVDAAALLFENPGVGSVLIEGLADMTDAYGNTTEEIVTRVWLSRATAQKINWDGLRDLQLQDNKHVFCIADDRFIDPTIYAKLKDKGCLVR